MISTGARNNMMSCDAPQCLTFVFNSLQNGIENKKIKIKQKQVVHRRITSEPFFALLLIASSSNKTAAFAASILISLAAGLRYGSQPSLPAFVPTKSMLITNTNMLKIRPAN